MPRKAYRCVVNLTLNKVTAPGVWLPSQEDVYLSVSLFGQYQTTRLLLSVFPLLVHEKLRFEKTYYTALDLADAADYLHDELVIFELVQLSEYTDGLVRLASFSSNVGEFLQPFPFHADSCSSADHEILLSRTIAFNGISPKLSFSTRTFIKESLSPELDALEDALEEERERRFFKKTHRVPTRRTRSAKRVSSSRHNIPLASYNPREDSPPPHYRQHTKSSLSRCQSALALNRIADIDLSDTTDPRPVFVVRKSDKELTGRAPGGAHTNRSANATRKDKNKSKSKSHSKKEKKSNESKSKQKVGSVHGDRSLCSECRAYRKATGRPCIGLGSFHNEHSHSRCLCQHMIIPRPQQPVHLYLPDDEDNGIYTGRCRPRSFSASMRYRPRIRCCPPPPEPAYYPPPRLVPCYDPSMYDLCM
ncbi:spermatogenesis-associated protein 6-like isoform X1 [Babylonia areolata]|uniref:spermatogenesis-associated protein 6-like isoform X1 n=1 Tax=Babylonia areolata TaxID=304850 RepID=UPI003FD4C534